MQRLPHKRTETWQEAGEIAAKVSAFLMETTLLWLVGCAPCSGTAVCSCRGVFDFFGKFCFLQPLVTFSRHHQVQSVVVCKASMPIFVKEDVGGSDSFKVGGFKRFL